VLWKYQAVISYLRCTDFMFCRLWHQLYSQCICKYLGAFGPVNIKTVKITAYQSEEYLRLIMSSLCYHLSEQNRQNALHTFLHNSIGQMVIPKTSALKGQSYQIFKCFGRPLILNQFFFLDRSWFQFLLYCSYSYDIFKIYILKLLL
jgi:hypothetical protein